MRDDALLHQRHAYVNIGSNNTNFIDAQGLRVGGASTSKDFGSWTAVAEMNQVLSQRAPGLKLTDHQIDQVLQSGYVQYGEQQLDLRVVAAEIWHHLTKSVIATMGQLWDECRQFSTIIFGGGCVHHIGAELREAYPWSTLHPVPEMGEVRGGYKFAQRVAAALKVGK